MFYRVYGFRLCNTIYQRNHKLCALASNFKQNKIQHQYTYNAISSSADNGIQDPRNVVTSAAGQRRQWPTGGRNSLNWSLKRPGYCLSLDIKQIERNKTQRRYIFGRRFAGLSNFIVTNIQKSPRSLFDDVTANHGHISITAHGGTTQTVNIEYVLAGFTVASRNALIRVCNLALRDQMWWRAELLVLNASDTWRHLHSPL